MASADRATVEAGLIVGGCTVLIAIGGGIGYFIRHYLDKQKAFSDENAKIKRDAYKKYVDKLHALNGIGKLSTGEVELLRAGFNDYLKEFHSTIVLFSSPKVVKQYASFVRYTDKKHSQAYQYELMLHSSRLFKAMRKEIGLSNRGLGLDGELLLRDNINDYDATIGEYTKWNKRLGRMFKKDIVEEPDGS